MDSKTRLYSCDDHLDFGAVPVDLWETRLPERLRERGPRVVEREGKKLWVADGEVIAASGANPTYSAIARAGIEDDGFRASDPKLSKSTPRSASPQRLGVCALPP